MITVLHRGVPENDYNVPQILGYYIRNMISINLTKNSGFFFSLGVMSKCLHYYIGGEGKMIKIIHDFILKQSPDMVLFTMTVSLATKKNRQRNPYDNQFDAEYHE